MNGDRTAPAATSYGSEVVPTHVLDFLRGVAAVYVVINHVRGSFFKGGTRTVADAIEPLSLYDYAALAVLQLTALGVEFVMLFFCVSGFAMAHAMRKSSSTLRFYGRRIIRIWPPYLVAIGLAAVVCLLHVQFDFDSRVSQRCAERLCTGEGLLLMAFYVQVSSPMTAQFWSLPYEVVFYLLCPLLLWSRALIPLVFGLSVVLMVIGIALWGLKINPSTWFIVNFAVNALFFFMSGAMAYYHILRVPLLDPRRFVITAIFTLGSVLAVKTAYGAPNAISNVIMIAFTLICLRSIPRSWTLNRLWNWGFFSYSIYIYHIAIIMLLSLVLNQTLGIQAADIASYWAWLLFLPPVLIGCWLMSFLAEKRSHSILVRMAQTQGDRVA